MNNIGNPRIYVDWGSWAKAMGIFEVHNITGGGWWGSDELWTSKIGLNPSNVTTFEGTTNIDHNYVRVESGAFSDEDYPNYVAVLGHNLASAKGFFYVETNNDGTDNTGVTEEEVINWRVWNSGNIDAIDYNGFSICTFDNADTNSGQSTGITINIIGEKFYTGESADHLNFVEDVKIGSICYGKYFDFPHSPDLKITQSIEMGQLTRQQSVIGGSISNSMQTPDMWGDLGAWELDSPSEQDDASKLGIRRGKRIWNLSFSYLSDKDTLPINALGNTIFDIANASSYDSTDYTDGAESAYFNSNVLDDLSFFSAVWNKTLGGHLPFIFQPDKDNNNPDQFAICKFQQDSLQVKQVANTVYNVKLKIREM